MDRLLREGNPPTGQLASPKPQYKKPGVDEYEPVEGQHGAPFAILKDASGNVVSPATEATLEQVRALLAGVATENKLEQARVLLQSISTTDFATQTTLAQVLAKLSNDPATATNQQAAKAVLDALASKDYATASKQDAAKAVLDAISTAVAQRATETTLAAILTKLADLATEDTLDDVKTAAESLAELIDSGALKTTLKGSNLALRQTIATGSKTVISTAAEIFAGASRLNNRHAMLVTNTGADIVYIGAVGVTTSNGFPIFPQDTLRIEFDPTSSVGVFACTSGTNVQVRVVELA